MSGAAARLQTRCRCIDAAAMRPQSRCCRVGAALRSSGRGHMSGRPAAAAKLLPLHHCVAKYMPADVVAHLAVERTSADVLRFLGLGAGLSGCGLLQRALVSLASTKPVSAQWHSFIPWPVIQSCGYWPSCSSSAAVGGIRLHAAIAVQQAAQQCGSTRCATRAGGHGALPSCCKAGAHECRGALQAVAWGRGCERHGGAI